MIMPSALLHVKVKAFNQALGKPLEQLWLSTGSHMPSDFCPCGLRLVAHVVLDVMYCKVHWLTYTLHGLGEFVHVVLDGVISAQ